ncbi:MAG: hypothetical protein D6719_13520 [Candidatus Dadabacteria bacterium]|nr:MAG: hypothetical protein D6719_13520 [Candidatus Dadabacteria bacterium]
MRNKALELPLLPLGTVIVPDEVIPVHVSGGMPYRAIVHSLEYGVPLVSFLEREGKLERCGVACRVLRVVERYGGEDLVVLISGREVCKLISEKRGVFFPLAAVVRTQEVAFEIDRYLRNEVISLFKEFCAIINLTEVPEKFHPARLSYQLTPLVGLDNPERLKLISIRDENSRLEELIKFLQFKIALIQYAGPGELINPKQPQQ